MFELIQVNCFKLSLKEIIRLLGFLNNFSVKYQADQWHQINFLRDAVTSLQVQNDTKLYHLS